MSKDTIYREDAILAMANALWHYPNDCYKNLNVYEFAKALAELGLRSLPSAQPEPISEEYAKAVRTWLINYQVRCAELAGRYTPYEILGWIVSDWRKENEIW